MSIEIKGALMPYPNNFAHTQAQKTRNGIRTIHCILLLTVSCLIAYLPVFRHDFQIKWDDWWVVMNDYTEGGFNWENIAAIITEFYHGQYAPVNELFYLTLYTLFGYNAFCFHTASLLVHIANVLLVFFLIKRLLQRSDDFSSVSVLRISFITGLLMALHPFLVEAVAWMSASKCLLFALFYLLALHAYLTYLSTQKLLYFGLTIFCFALSFGSKEQAVTLPVCLLLFDYVLKRNMRTRDVWLEKLPLFILTAGFILLTFYSQLHNGEGILSRQPMHAWYQNMVFAAYSVTEYFIKCLIPLKLTYIYPFPNLPGQPMPLYFWIYPFLVLFVAIGFWKFWKQRWNAFGMGFFLIQATVICNIIPTARFAIIADRYVYLPAMGVFFLMAYGTDQLLKRKSKYKYAIVYGSMLYVLCLGVYTNQRSKVWHNSITLKKEMQQVLKSRSDYSEWKKKYDLLLQEAQH